MSSMTEHSICRPGDLPPQVLGILQDLSLFFSASIFTDAIKKKGGGGGCKGGSEKEKAHETLKSNDNNVTHVSNFTSRTGL